MISLERVITLNIAINIIRQRILMQSVEVVGFTEGIYRQFPVHRRLVSIHCTKLEICKTPGFQFLTHLT